MKLVMCLMAFLVAVVSIHSAHLGRGNRVARSSSDDSSDDSNSNSDSSSNEGGQQQVMSSEDENDGNNNEDMTVTTAPPNCVMTQTCVFVPNLLSLDQPTFGAVSVALASIDVTVAAASVRQLIEEGNSLASGTAPPANPCLNVFTGANGPITYMSNFLFDVDIINTDGTFPAFPPNTPTSNLNVTITYRDLMSFDRLQVTFQLDNSGLPFNVERLFFATTANNGTITFPSAMAVSATDNPGQICTLGLPLVCGPAVMEPTPPMQTIPDLPTVVVTEAASVSDLLASQRQC